jgi:predicted dithiol-disulfide oxidoreductase (DUF899 family)
LLGWAWGNIMTYEMIDGTFRQTNLKNESDDYLAKREQLRLAEIELMKQRERVAEIRRALPQGAAITDYEFLEGPRALDGGDSPIRKVKISELFSSPERPLVIYQLMFGKKQTKPCPMCTLWIDGYNGVAHHIAQNMDFAIVAAAEPILLRAYARERGWHNLRLLSAGESSFKYDLGGENPDGGQDSALNVFTKSADGTVWHSYTQHPKLAQDINERGIDLLTPVFNLMDVTPRGRGNWYPSLGYGTKAHGQ